MSRRCRCRLPSVVAQKDDNELRHSTQYPFIHRGLCVCVSFTCILWRAESLCVGVCLFSMFAPLADNAYLARARAHLVSTREVRSRRRCRAYSRARLF